MSSPYTIRAVSERTGLSQHTIRAWERRYGALEPSRTGTNRRLYSEADIERLTLLKRLTSAGHSIGQIADVPEGELKRILGSVATKTLREELGSPESPMLEAEAAVTRLDAEGLDRILSRAWAETGVRSAIEQLVIPLIGKLDRGWSEGTLTIAHEHMTSAVLRTQLERMRASLAPQPNAPRLLVTTPSGQTHELGAQLVATLAALHSWRVTYLGPNLPAAEIAAAAAQTGARAVALSIVYPEDPSVVEAELETLRRLAGVGLEILVGGRAALSFQTAIERIGAKVIDLDELGPTLSRLVR